MCGASLLMEWKVPRSSPVTSIVLQIPRTKGTARITHNLSTSKTINKNDNLLIHQKQLLFIWNKNWIWFDLKKPLISSSATVRQCNLGLVNFFNNIWIFTKNWLLRHQNPRRLESSGSKIRERHIFVNWMMSYISSIIAILQRIDTQG